MGEIQPRDSAAGKSFVLTSGGAHPPTHPRARAPVCVACQTDCKILDLAGEESPQIYALCGKGARSTLRTMRHGLAVTEMAVSELPGERPPL